jgi:hypothetical protein
VIYFLHFALNPCAVSVARLRNSVSHYADQLGTRIVFYRHVVTSSTATHPVLPSRRHTPSIIAPSLTAFNYRSITAFH